MDQGGCIVAIPHPGDVAYRRIGVAVEQRTNHAAVAVAVAHWRVGDHPENTAYIMEGVEDAGALLDQMREWGAGRVYAALRRACAAPVTATSPSRVRPS